ncbi:MAG: SDR family oxidoreductase [Oscillospiraceae bacterium]|nr:SDR family oxidoreductase [Oscillospiraceae bacterium]
MEKQKRALVTGASRGIGRAIAIALSEDGYEVILHCATGVQKAEEVKSIIEQAGGKATILTADLCDPVCAKAMAQQMGDVDVLVLNVSIQIRKPWQEITLEEANAQINCNFLSSLTLIQEAVPYMKTQKWGRIITIGSVQEAKPHPDMLIYSSIKAAQTAMVKSLSLQLAKDGITVNNVAPGVIYTDRNREALADPDYAKKVSDSIPAGYYGEPEDCAGIISLLCSEKGRYITGQSIFVDGGKSVQ